MLLWDGVQTRIVDARRADGDYYLVPLEGDPVPPVGATVRGAVEDARRTALMRTHSGLHVLAVSSLPRAEAFEIPDVIRTATKQGAPRWVPEDVKDVRIVDIVGLDRQADGGTHVASTAVVGRISVVKVENKGKGFRRLRIAISD